MKLANITANVQGMKFNAVKVLAAATLAGGLLVAAAPAAGATCGGRLSRGAGFLWRAESGGGAAGDCVW